ncbi:MAG: ATP-binding protein, partial [Rhodospirillales bacterium]|nr:ATP-binding protein [Rhodospirillales bacterium]
MMVTAFVASVLVFIVAWYSLNKIEQSAYEETGQALNAVRDSIRESLHRWHGERTDDVLTWAKSSQIKRLTEELLKTKASPELLKSNAALAEMRSYLRPVLENGKYLGFFIISMDGINLASARDKNVGTHTLIDSAFFKKILSDGTAVSHPQISDVALPGVSGKMAEGEATMFVGAPVKDGNGTVRAYLTLRIDSLRDFAEILKGGRIGKTGESYAFDAQGRLISVSRYRNRLIEYGMVAIEKTELLNVDIRDPGGNLAAGYRPKNIKQQPLTEMARRALEGKPGTSLIGYRNYLGDVVIGSWVWEPELDVGIATEISVGEAFKFLVTTRQYVLFTVVISFLLLIGLSIVFLLGQKRIAQSEENLQTVVDSAPDGFITINEIGTIERYNLAAENIFGYRSHEVIGKNVKMLMPEPYHSQHDGYLLKFMTTGEKKIIGKSREVEGLRKDGTVFPLDLIISEARVGSSRKFVGITRDITEEKRVERMKAEFVSTVSHELRTPLTSIRGALGLINGGAVGEIQPKARGMVSLALKNTERLIGLVNDILDMEKIESGKMEFSFDLVNISDLAKQAIESDRAYADELGVALVLTKEIQDGYVIGDPDRLSQVMANLISNAAKFSHKGGEVEVAIERINNQIRVSVTDKGLGIQPGFKNKIFQRFSQADATDTRRTGGTGLGLNISKAIIERHGGSINFESVVGRGTTFYFEMQEKSLNDRIQKNPETAIAAGRGKFLV